MGYKIGFRDEGKQESTEKEELIEYKLKILKQMQYPISDDEDPEVVKIFENAEIETKEEEMPKKIPEYSDDMEVTSAEGLIFFKEWLKVLYAYDTRLAKLEIAQKKTQNIILEQAQGITIPQLVGVGAVLFAITFSAVALALKVIA